MIHKYSVPASITTPQEASSRADSLSEPKGSEHLGAFVLTDMSGRETSGSRRCRAGSVGGWATAMGFGGVGKPTTCSRQDVVQRGTREARRSDEPSSVGASHPAGTRPAPVASAGCSLGRSLHVHRGAPQSREGRGNRGEQPRALCPTT